LISAVWVFCVCFALAFILYQFGHPKDEALSIPEAARVKTLRRFALVWILLGFLFVTAGNLVGLGLAS
jgi:hypothetical protein